jgi:N-acetylmuramoyl-L-alanine amidase
VARTIFTRILISFLFGAPLFTAQAYAVVRPHPFKVVIDPGHGGSDTGTIYEMGTQRVVEKDLTLALALVTAKMLRSHKITTILTRTTDKDVPLGDRTALANRLKADVFLSIHMNSTQTPMVTDAEGIETYILNNTSDETSKRLAHLENTVLSPEVRAAAADSPEQLDVALILRDLRLDANLSESKRLACIVQTRLVQGSHRSKNRGVRQALFHVLLGAEMPSILVEAGFLSNPRDRAIMLSPRGRLLLGSAIAHAIERFRDTRGTSQAQLTLSRCKVH